MMRTISLSSLAMGYVFYHLSSPLFILVWRYILITSGIFTTLQLWDVIEDQAAIDLVRPILVDSNNTNPNAGSSSSGGSGSSAQEAAQRLVKYALEHFSSDNISVLVVRLEGGWKGK